MPALERSIAIRGPRFFVDADTIMFVHHYDASTRDGPREATDADRASYPEAWDRLAEEMEKPPEAPLQRIEVLSPDVIPAPPKRQLDQTGKRGPVA